jgi:hypothetical protein
MNTQTMLKSKWYLVEMFTAKKCFRITVRKPLDTKAEATQFENSRVKAHNYKSLCKLIEEGYEDLNVVNEEVIETVEENATEQATESVNAIEQTEQLNPEIEAQIEAYAQAKIERDIKAYEAKKAKQDAVKNFLNTPPSQPKVNPFNYDKQLEEFY